MSAKLQMHQTERASRERFHNLVSSGILEALEWQPETGERQYYYMVGESKRAVDCLESLKRVVRRVAEGTSPPWKEISVQGKPAWVMSRESKLLWRALSRIDEAPGAWGREGEMTPYLRLGFLLARKWEPRLRFYTNARSELSISDETPRKILSRVIRLIRRVSKAEEFRRRVGRLEMLAKERNKECAKYFVANLGVHARLLFLRGDLYFEAGAKKAASEGRLEMAFEKLVRNLREGRIIDGVLGYIIKLENAYDRGVHLHLIVFVDGDKHIQSYSLMEMIKQYWIHECVGSPQFASGFNCYHRRDEYKYNAIGLVHYADEEKLLGVRSAIEYLAKSDCLFLLPESMGRSLRKGQMPRAQVSGARRGAPRKYGSDVRLAERILLGKGDALPVGIPRSGSSDGGCAVVSAGCVGATTLPRDGSVDERRLACRGPASLAPGA